MTSDKGILIRNIYYMLTYAFQELRQNNYDDIAGEEFDNILDLFAEILVRGVSFQLKRGLHKDYIPESDDIATIRGKINLNETIRLRLHRKKLVSCDFDNFTEDNLHNQIIKSTLSILISSEEVKAIRKRRLRSLLLFFTNVSECNLKNTKWSSITYDSNSSTYRILHHFCYFVVKRLLLTTQSGPFKMKNFDEEFMSRLFEKFVLCYYRRHFSQYSPRSAKVDWNIDVEESTVSLIPEMRTDIMLTFPNRTLIIDTKYYSQSMQVYMDKVTIHSNNLYQINSYVMHEDKTHAGDVDGMLLYAKTQEPISPNGKMKLKAGNVIYFCNLDLNQDFKCIEHQLKYLIKDYMT